MPLLIDELEPLLGSDMVFYLFPLKQHDYSNRCDAQVLAQPNGRYNIYIFGRGGGVASNARPARVVIYQQVAAIQLKDEGACPGRVPPDDSADSEGDTWAWLVDMEGAGPTDAPGWKTLRTLDDILYSHYPGRLSRVLIVNASGDVIFFLGGGR